MSAFQKCKATGKLVLFCTSNQKSISKQTSNRNRKMILMQPNTHPLNIKSNGAGLKIKSRVQELAERINMSVDEFIGEMRKLGCSEPTAMKIWRGEYEEFDHFNDNNVQLSNLRKASVILKVGTGSLLPK